MSEIIQYPKVVYLEAVLMENRELIHMGKTVGRVTERQQELVENGACKLTKGSQPVVAIQPNEA